MSGKRVAVVTGANKGIGTAIVKALCKQFNGTVILTARDTGRGQAAVEELKKEGFNPVFHQLEISSKESAESLRDYLVQTFGGLDVLVNNAGMAYKDADPTPFTKQAEVSNKVNFFGTLNVCDVLFPILRPHARVVHVSSFVSTMFLNLCSEDLKKTWVSTSSKQQCVDLINKFISDANSGVHKKNGWPDSAYGVSKLGVTSITPLQQAEFDKDTRKDIIVNAACPGYVNTDMSSHKGHLTVDEGADTPVYLALLPPNTPSPRGEFVSKRKIVNWRQGECASKRI